MADSSLTRRAAIDPRHVSMSAVAELLWGLPPDVVRHYSLMALPIHPTLAALRPGCPSWGPAQGDSTGFINAIEGILRDFVDRVADERSGDELIAFSTPRRDDDGALRRGIMGALDASRRQ